MSRIGRMPIPLPDGVEVAQDGNRLTVKGPLGTLERELHPEMTPRARGRQRCASCAPATSRATVRCTA